MPETIAVRVHRMARGLGTGALVAIAIAWRVVDRTFRDGFIHAGNLAFLSLVTLFPAAVLLQAVAVSLGRTEAGRLAVAQFLVTLPEEVSALVGPVLEQVLEARSGTALLLGAAVALWTTSGFIGTIRDLLRRVHEAEPARPFWQERLLSIAVTIGAMLAALLGFLVQLAAQVALSVARALLPALDWLGQWVDASRIAAVVVLFLGLWALIAVLTPRRVRAAAWPGALVITIVWVGATALIGPWLAAATGFSLTYGALAGVILALLFFQVIGLAVVLGAELNAALAKRAEIALRVAELLRQDAGPGPRATGRQDGKGDE